jgi:hypothetical protein
VPDPAAWSELADPLERLHAVASHSASFWTWRSLCHDNGLSNRDAIKAMTDLAAMTAGLRQP